MMLRSRSLLTRTGMFSVFKNEIMSENELIFEERFSCEKTMNDPLRQS
jgi:hypothetical protein